MEQSLPAPHFADPESYGCTRECMTCEKRQINAPLPGSYNGQ